MIDLKKYIHKNFTPFLGLESISHEKITMKKVSKKRYVTLPFTMLTHIKDYSIASTAVIVSSIASLCLVCMRKP